MSSTAQALFELTHDAKRAKLEPEVIYAKWSVQAPSKQTHAQAQ